MKIETKEIIVTRVKVEIFNEIINFKFYCSEKSVDSDLIKYSLINRIKCIKYFGSSEDFPEEVIFYEYNSQNSNTMNSLFNINFKNIPIEYHEKLKSCYYEEDKEFIKELVECLMNRED